MAPARATPWFREPTASASRRQPFQAGEARTLRVRFFVEPQLPAYIDRLTLSYTLIDGVSTSPPAGARPGSFAKESVPMAHAHAESSKYYVPHGSPWPILR